MQVKLRVLEGKSAGVEVPIVGTKFLIGRSDDCQLRPKSEAVSRLHCAILVRDGKVAARDLKSRNGTYVNDERIESDRLLQSGDIIRIGKLSFELLIEVELGGSKKPKVKDLKDAATRTASASISDSTCIDTDVSRWLEEADQTERVRKRAEPETRQFKLDETLQVPAPGTVETPAVAEDSDSDQDDSTEDSKKKKAKKEFGKLPPRPAVESENSCDAAAQMLKKLFSGR